MRVDLPDGHWAELRDTASHREGKALLKTIYHASQAITDPFDAGQTVADVITTWAVIGWSYPVPVPSEDPNSLEELDSAAADALTKLAVSVQERLIPSFGKGSAPTTPSSDSPAPSRATETATPAPTRPSGASTSSRRVADGAGSRSKRPRRT